MKLSLIIPVYNRPQEVLELLESLVHQTDSEFEVVIVEDGSTQNSEEIVNSFKDKLRVAYFFKPNSGPGLSRNYGFERATGDFGIFLDSDCIIPSHYVETVKKQLQETQADCFGGPDRASSDFTPFQKAISYSMTSPITTGGIRGGGEKMDAFHPRSFNMGYSRLVFEKTEGFSALRFGEDIDMSLRIIRAGFSARLFKDAFVYHKRRTSFRPFFKQIFNSGIARINLEKRHPGTLKLVHALPALFTVGSLGLILLGFWNPLFWLPLAALCAVLFFHSWWETKSIRVALLSVQTSFVQLYAYGLGFIIALWKRVVLGKAEFASFEKTFYD